MKINIQSRGFSLTPALKTFVAERFLLVLARFEGRVMRVEVVLLDINGPRGGLDKRCRVQLKLEGYAAIVIQETHEDLYEVVVS